MRLWATGRSHIFRPLAALSAVVFVSILLLQLLLVNVVRKEIDDRLADLAAQQEDIVTGRLETQFVHLRALASFIMAGSSHQGMASYIKQDKHLSSMNYVGAAAIDGSIIFGHRLPETAKVHLKDAYYGHAVAAYVRAGDTDLSTALLMAVPIVRGDTVAGVVYGLMSGQELDETLFAGNLPMNGQLMMVSEDRHTYIFPMRTTPDDASVARELRFIENSDEIGRLYQALYRQQRAIARVECGSEIRYFAAAPSRILRGWYNGILVPRSAMRETIFVVVLFTAGTFILLALLFIGAFFYVVRVEEQRRAGLLKVAYVDSLTGLPKWEKLRQEKEQDQQKQNAVLAIFDIDYFGAVNAMMGADYGDSLLRKISIALEQSLEAEDCLARGTGDRFLLYTYGRSGMMDKLLAICNLITETSNKYPITVTGGAVSLAGDLTMDEGYSRAVEACEAAHRQKADKGTSDNLVVMYDSNVSAEMVRKRTLRDDFEQAFIQREFQPLLQPLRKMSEDDWAAAELMMRWNHPKYGIVDVHELLDNPEESKRRTRLDKFMLDSACHIIRRWLNDGRRVYPISVTFSHAFLVRANIIDEVTRIMKLYEVSPEYLMIDIKESAFSLQPEVIKASIRKLGEAGFAVTVSDFRFDCGLLPELVKLPVKRLKLDKSSFGRITGKSRRKTDAAEQADEIVVSDDVRMPVQLMTDFITMAGHMGIEVIVSGVDKEDEHEALKGTGCSMIQGFCCSRPMTVLDYEEVVYGGGRQ
ncbi:MAG: EAL domain-containing protein [Selenomonadaceae bacterium]|nr:EAL domain-containing protein [Selenomonadaceae bacterium]